MLLFDTLDELESYQKLIPGFNQIIDTLDHSRPYDEGPGDYSTKEKDGIRYTVDTYLSSLNGFASPKSEGLVLEICLEGEELLSADGSVFKLSPGRFVIYEGSMDVKRGIMYSSPIAFKAVRFFIL